MTCPDSLLTFCPTTTVPPTTVVETTTTLVETTTTVVATSTVPKPPSTRPHPNTTTTGPTTSAPPTSVGETTTTIGTPPGIERHPDTGPAWVGLEVGLAVVLGAAGLALNRAAHRARGAR